MMTAALCREQDSQLILIDLQARLFEAMAPSLSSPALKNWSVLLQASRELDIPLHVTRQYPKGLGELVDEVALLLGNEQEMQDKTCFSCCRSDGFLKGLGSHRKQLILAGMESHVCVLQTAHELLAEGYEVFVVEDAVCSRAERNHRNAMERLRQAGVIITNTESVIFEWLGDAGHAMFKSVSKLIK
ncbi:MAG: isochorismatase family protein [Gammaproteobacteria bacterium]|nr:isochorismatase family protein [Gammaproteobacteria bacterium]